MTVRHLPKIITSIKPKYSLSIIPILAIVTIFALATHASTPNTSGEAESGTLASCASSINDSSASNSKAVQFGSGCSGSTTPPLSLDATGATIPDTDYAIPAGAIFMATNGDDSNAGTQSAPVATLAKAISLVPTGGTIVVRAGIYRQGKTTNITKTFTIQNYPHEQVWFDGTDVETGWTSDGTGQWYKQWSTPDFCHGGYYNYAYNDQQTNGPCAYNDEYNDPNNLAAADPQMVYKDGQYIHEDVCPGDISTLPAGDFCYQEDLANQTGKIYLGFDPAGHTVELAKRQNAMVLQSGSGGNVIRGIGFERYASSEFGGSTAGGAVSVVVPNVTIEDCVFKEMSSNGLAVANPTGAVVKDTVLVNNGGNGIIGNGHQHGSGATDGIVFEGNLFNANNREHFGVGCNYACNAAGMKISHMDGFTLKNNIFENGVGVAKGFWCDLACSDGVMVDNIFRNNGGAGLMYEVGDTGIIASNLIYDNGAQGLKMGSANTEIYNNTIVNSGSYNVLIYDDARSPGVNGWTDVGPDTTNVDFSNNVVYGSGDMMWAINAGGTMPPNTGPDTFFSGLDYNSYYRTGGASQMLFYWKQNSSSYTHYYSLSSLTADHNWESHSNDVTDGSNPFVDLSGDNYNLKSSSPSYHSGTSLPSDVANAVGVSTSAGQNRGALIYPGSN